MENCGKTFGVVQNFRRIFEWAAADGRGEALFGADALEKGAAALRFGAVAGMEHGVTYYFEFPFTGPARMDLMVSYACAGLPSPLVFAEGDGCGFRPFFEACAADPALSSHSCGFSFDLSDMADKEPEEATGMDAPARAPQKGPAFASRDARPPRPGIYLLPPYDEANVDYVPTMLSRLGGADRVPKVMAAFASAPAGWQPYYAGYMPGRRGAPTRLGFIVSDKAARYAKEPGQLMEDAEAFAGVRLFSGTREELSFLFGSGGAWDLQFDLRPDGTFADDFGVTLGFGFGRADPRTSAGFLERGLAGEAMQRIEAAGLADARWRLMDKACCGVGRFVRGADGKLMRVGDMVKLNAVKVRFRHGEPYLAKGYLIARSQILQ